MPPAPEPVIANAAVPVQLLISEPADAVGIVPQLIFLELVGLVPAQLPLPVTDNVAVNDPEDVLGVKVARAWFAFCVQEPDPAPPLHVSAL